MSMFMYLHFYMCMYFYICIYIKLFEYIFAGKTIYRHKVKGYTFPHPRSFCISWKIIFRFPISTFRHARTSSKEESLEVKLPTLWADTKKR